MTQPQTAQPSDELFTNIGSTDFLPFSFNGRKYQDQIDSATNRTKKFSAISVEIRQIKDIKVVWIAHDFGFMGGSLGCAEGEKITKAFEFALHHSMPVIVVCRSGGARMQEGTLSLMQLAKVSVAVEALKQAKIPYISICEDPTYGGVSASYGMQGDVRIGIKGARIGFAGPAVILNTVYKMDQAAYDAECPQRFQTAEFLLKHGQLDIVLEHSDDILDCVHRILQILWKFRKERESSLILSASQGDMDDSSSGEDEKQEEKKKEELDKNDLDYTQSRSVDRFTSEQVINTVFENYIELAGDGKVGSDPCIHGGIATIGKQPCVVICTYKGPDANWGMSSPAGYRMAHKLMSLAEHFEIPVFTLIDTVGAFPSFESEQEGQSEAIATNLSKMARLAVPIISIVIGEGGSGGALAIGMGDRVAMMERAYYAVISPEGAASILGRYQSEEHKSEQFPKDCNALAEVQKIYASYLIELGVIDTIISEEGGASKNDCKKVMERIKQYFISSMEKLLSLSPQRLVEKRYKKFSSMGKWTYVSEEKIKKVASQPTMEPRRRRRDTLGQPSKTLTYIADQTINSSTSSYLGKQPPGVISPNPPKPRTVSDKSKHINAKSILDSEGPDAVVKWLHTQKKVLVTDTTMRDAHQSLLATRVRTFDLLNAASETCEVLKDAFSLEVWGGATFDVCYRFLHECPWKRLRLLRERIPNIMLQMLLRGSNAVGYTNYPDNVIKKFVELAAENGIDVFRIFDCFNSVEQMQLAIDTVKECGKIAEVCICFTGNFLSPDEKIYTLDYYKDLASQIVKSGAHMIGIKDMAGLMRPQMAAPFVEAIRSVTDLPLHFHCHNTSSASLATVINMAHAGCNIVDLAIASMADTTSQASLNSFLAAMEGHERDPGIPYLSMENLDSYWSQVRTIYQPFESGLKHGTARVYEHQIPGGQYSNLFSQSKSLGIMDKWDEVLDMYRDVNLMFGNIIKVTPSSKCVGDMALFLIRNNMTCKDVEERGEEIEFPNTVVALFHGDLGYPHHGLPKKIQEKVLKGREPLKCRPGKLLEDADFDAERERLRTKWPKADIGEEEVVSSLLYPKVFDDYMTWLQKYGWKVFHINSEAFFFGMKIGQEIIVDIPNEEGVMEKHTIKLTRIGSLSGANQRVLEFMVDGEKRKARVTDKAAIERSGASKKADLSDPRQIPSPLPGFVEVIYVGEGSDVKKSDPIMIVSAMKMQVEVKAPYDGVVKSFEVKVGDRVDVGSLLAIVEEKEKKGEK